MRTKLFALALAAILAIGTGGVVAADSASPDHVQPDDRSSDAETQADDERPTVSDDTRLTADEHIELDPSVIVPLGDGLWEISLQDPMERDVSVDDEGDGTMTVGSGADSEAAATDDDAQRLTVDEHVTLHPNVIWSVGDGLFKASLQDPMERDVSVGDAGDGTVSVETQAGDKLVER